MTAVADVAFGSSSPGRGVRGWEVAAFAAASAIAACVSLSLIWAGTPTYRAIAEENPSVRFVRLDTGEPAEMSVESLARFHDGWLAYVTGRHGLQPAETAPWFTDEERRHMADVRRVFVSAELLAVAGAVLLAVLARRARRRGALARLVRAGTVTAALGVGLLGTAFALWFDSVFLLFHQIVFPQGNFLFPPGSNLLVIYPEAYWYGVTLRIAASFLALAAVVAGAAHITLLRSLPPR